VLHILKVDSLTQYLLLYILERKTRHFDGPQHSQLKKNNNGEVVKEQCVLLGALENPVFTYGPTVSELYR